MAYRPGQMNSVSFTRLEVFETCPHQAKLRFIDKTPELPKVPPPGKKEHPMDRGSRVHNEAEAFVKGERSTQPVEFKKLEKHLDAAKELHQKGRAVTEETWAFSSTWEVRPPPPTAWSDWYIKTDLAVDVVPGTHALIVDYKTGKGWQKSFAFTQQLQLYAIGAFARYPELTTVSCEIWLPDTGKVANQVTYTRRHALALVKGWNTRAATAMGAKVFPAKPSEKNCRYCPHGTKNGTGVCSYAYKE